MANRSAGIALVLSGILLTPPPVSSSGSVAARAHGPAQVTQVQPKGRAETSAIPEPNRLEDLFALYPFRSDKGSVQVRSDISENFSREHADHADNVWRFFSRVFARSPGRRIELYYTENVSLYQRVFAFCPSIVIPGGRQVTTCFDESERFYRWFIVPFRIPDFATQLHEIGHSFLFFTYEASEDNPWIKEGTGMYYESGHFIGDDLVVSEPIDWLKTNFNAWHGKGLVPLGTLLRMSRNTFYGRDASQVYSQAGMLIFYLFAKHPSTMSELIDGLNPNRK